MKRTTLTTAVLVASALGVALGPTIAGAADPPKQSVEQVQPDVQPQVVNEAAFLGVDVAPIEPGLRQDLDLKPGTAVMIRRIGPGTPADEAGLKSGDVLVKLNDQLLINPQQLAVLVRTFAPGDVVTLHVLRDGATMKLQATLAGRALTPEVPMLRVQPAAPFGDLDAMFDQLRGPGFDPFMPGMDMRDMFDQMQRRMFEQRDEMQRMMDQMRDRLGEQGMQSLISINDGEHAIQLRSNGQDKHLRVTTQQGEVLFDGPLDENGQAEGLPKPVQEKVDELLKNNRIQFRLPQPKPQQRKPLPIA